jgi:DNA-binding transcriptional ArsR family regulator
MDMFYALAEPRRRKIIELLASSGQLPATEICNKFNVTAQAISQHLKVLLDAKLVLVEKHAQQRIYQLNPKTVLELENWAKHTTEIWEERFDSLDVVLAKEKKKLAKNKIKRK